MGEPQKSHDGRSGTQHGSAGWHGEIVELASLFLAVVLAELFANMLVHRPLGPIVLTVLGVLLLLSAMVRRWWTHRPARPQVAGPVTDLSESGREAAGGGNLWRVRAAVRDTPGSLAALAASLASHRFNILSVQVHTVAEGAVDEFLIEAPPGTAWRDVVAATESGGGWEVHANRADVHDLVDVPTRVLMLAAQSTGTGVQLPAALRMLLGSSTICRRELGGGATGDAGAEPGRAGLPDRTDGVDGTTMRLREPGGGLLTLQRAELAFTPAEFARARALRDLDLSFRARGAVADRADRSAH